MDILLFSMPDSFEHMPTIAIRMPNGALTSLAGNVDPHHRVAAADLLLVQSRVRETVERLVAEHEPDVVGLGNDLPAQDGQRDHRYHPHSAPQRAYCCRRL